MYKRKWYQFRNSIEVEEYHNGRYGAPGEKRGKRKKATPEQIARQNQRNKEKGIRRLIKANFTVNDYWVTLTYRRDARPPNLAAAKEDVKAFRRRLAKQYKKLGIPFKWIQAIEIGSRGGIHCHMIINRAPDGDKLLAENWPHGRPHTTLLYEQGDFRELAEYIGKEPERKEDKHYSRSRNLVKPEAHEKLMKGRTWRQELRAPKGYYVDKETLVEGINPVTGYPYRSYTLMKIRGRYDADKIRSKSP